MYASFAFNISCMCGHTQILLARRHACHANTEQALLSCYVTTKVVVKSCLTTIYNSHFTQQMVFRKILQPLIHVISSNHLSFPTGGLARSVIAFKLVDIITTIALRIGREMTREHMTGLLQQFFVCFEFAHGENGRPGNLSSPGKYHHHCIVDQLKDDTRA